MSHICTSDESSNIGKRWNQIIGISGDLLEHVWPYAPVYFPMFPTYDSISLSKTTFTYFCFSGTATYHSPFAG
jgi:hypothetical protein